ncbi:MAG: DUF11 domain-containing protein [Acidimicrobiales bacterium]|nr:DUF11 domain-containing protein [Acidimicrobiales bacterium]
MKSNDAPRLRRAAGAVLVVVLVAIGLAMVGAPQASAAPPAPEATLSVPASSFIGTDVSFSVSFDNADVDAAGYGPYVDLWLPVTGVDGAGNAVDDGLTFATASYLGSDVTSIPLTITNCGGSQTHPFTGLPIVCPAGFRVGDQLVVLELPFGSFSPGQPAATISVTASMSNLADLGTPLPIAARAGFRYGDTPTGSTPIVQGAPDTATVEPTLVSMTKTYLGPEDETATGPNFPRQYRLDLGVAPGQVLTDLDLTDLLPDNLVYLGAGAITPAGSITVEPPSTTTPQNAPDNELTVNFPTVTGTGGAGDASVTVDFYVPDLDANGDPVIDPGSGDDATSVNQSSALGDWAPIDTRDAGGVDNVSASAQHRLTPKSIAAQKSVAVVDDVGTPGASPGDTLEWSIAVQVSDYFTFAGVTLDDVFTDGQTLDPGFDPTLQFADGNESVDGTIPAGDLTVSRADAPCGDGSTALGVDLSDAVATMGGGDGVLTGGLATGGDTGATTATIVFRTVVDSNYHCLDSANTLDSGDRLSNDVTVAGEVYDNATQLPQAVPAFEDDGSGAGVTIVAPALNKSIYAVNGDVPADPDDPTGLPNRTQFAPGDEITYRLTATVPLTNVEQLRLEDYLPLPVLAAAGFSGTVDTTPNPTGALPPVGSARLGSLDTFTATTGRTPTASVDTTSNSLTFAYADVQNQDGRSSAVIDILLRLKLSDDPFVDGLYLTNQARLWYANSFADVANADDIIQIELTQPALSVTKGVVASNNPAATFSPTTVGPVAFTAPTGSVTPPRWAGTIDSAGLAAHPVNSNITGGVDAGDLVTHAIVVENTGSGLHGAFDVRISDVLPAGYEVPGTVAALNLQVTDGAGNPLAWTDLGGGLFGTGIELVDDTASDPDQGSLAAYQASGGANIAVVTYNLKLDHTTDPDPVSANQTLTNTAAVDQYAGAEGAEDHTGPTSLTDAATVRTARPAITKTITGTDQAHTTGNDVAIGEQVSYQVRIAVPEGTHPGFTVTDTLARDLAFVSFDSASASGALTTTANGGDWSAAGTTPAVTPVNAGGASDGRVATWDFGTVTNTDTDNATTEEITLTYTAVVANTARNQNNGTRANSVVTSFGGSAAAPAARIREPNVQVDKTVAPSVADAGDTVTFTMVVDNTTGTSDAFEVNLADTIPAGFTYVPGTFTHTAGIAPTSGPDDSAAPDLTTAWSRLNVGQTSTLEFDATVDPGINLAVLAAGLTNTATVDYSSLPGAQGPTSALESTFGVERTGDTADIGGAANDYRDSDGATVMAPDATIAKSIAATSEASTTATSVTVGEVVSYDVLVNLPEGDLSSFSVVDAVPAGMGYVGGSAQVSTSHPLLGADFGGTLGAVTVTPVADGADGQDVTIDVGATSVTAGNPDDNAIVVSLDLVVLDVAGNRGDDPATGANEATSLVNRATVNVAGRSIVSAPATVTVVEPRMVITKVFTPGQAAADDTVDVTLEVTNQGTSTSFDTVVTDLLEGDAFPAAGIAEGTTPAGFAYTATAEGDNDTRVTYTGGDIAVGQTVTFTFSVTLADPVPVPGSIVNTAVVSQATTLPTGHPGGDGAERDEPDVTGQDQLTFTAPDLRVVKDDGVQVRSPGDAYDYTITVHNDGGRDATGIDLTDNLPPGLAFASASDGGTEAAGVVSWPAFDLAAGAQRSFTVSVVVDNPLADSITDFLNTAEAADDGTHGPDPVPDNNRDSDLDTTDAAVDVAVTKDDGTQIRTPGEQYTYTLDVTNQGNQDESGITLTDTLPPGLRFDSASDGGTEAAGVVTWPAFSLVGGASTSRTVTVTVDDPLAAGIDEVVNRATVSSPDDANPANNEDTDTDTAAATPDLTITKDDGQTVASPGEALTYEVVVDNVGGQNATGVVVTDTLPAGVSFDSASDGGTESAGVVTWPAFDLAVGADPVTFTVTVIVDDPITAVSLLNTATVADDGTNGLDPTPDDNTALDVDGSVPDLRVVKDDGTQTRTPGESYDYTVTVHNDGGVDATGVTLTDTLPAELTFEGATDGGAHDGAPVGGEVVWDLGTIAPGDARTVSVSVQVVEPLPNGTTQVVNRASAVDDGANGPDPTPANNSDTDTDTVDGTVDVGVVKDDGTQTRTPGEEYTYSLAVTNDGDENAIDVALADTLPAGLSFVRASDGGTEDAGVVSWPLFDLDGNGGTTTRTVTVTVDDPLAAGIDLVENTTEVTAPADANPDNDTDTDTDEIDAAPDLSVIKDDGETVASPGEQLTYTLTVTNRGDQGASGVALTDVLPAGVTFDSASDGGTENAGLVSWPAVDLAGDGATFTRTVTVIVDDPAAPGVLELSNRADVADDGTNGPDPTPDDNSATDVDRTIGDLRLVKDDGVQTRTPGEAYTYTLTVFNDGGADVQGAQLVDTLPAEVVFDAASDGGTHDGSSVGGDVTWDLGTIAGGTSVSVTVDVHVRRSLPNGTTQILNDAVVTHDEVDGPDPTPGNNRDTDEDSTQSVIDVGVVKDDGVQTRTPGEQFSYSLVVTNQGDQDAVDVTLTDTLPAAGLAFVSASGGGIEDAGVLTWPAFDLAGDGGTVTFTVTVRVDDPLAISIDNLDNRADVTTVGDVDPDNDTDHDVDLIDAAPDLSVRKDDAQTVVVEGQVLTYTLVVTNAGNQDAVDVDLADTLPAGLTFVSASDGGTEDSGVVTWPAFDLPGGGATATRTVVATVDTPLAADVTSLLNTATVADDGTNGPDPTPDDNVGTDRDDVGQAAIALAKTVYRGHDGGAGCAGSESVTGVNGRAVTYCFVVTNTGAVTLAPVTLVDGDLGIDQRDMTLLSGDLTTLAPGDSTVLFFETTLDGDLTNTASATGTPVDGGGAPLPGVPDVTDDDTAAVDQVAPAMTILTEVQDPFTGDWFDADGDAGTLGGNDPTPATYSSGDTASFRFTVTNTGDAPITDVALDAPGCDAPPTLVSGDDTNPGVLDVGEVWVYTCEVADVTAGLTVDAGVTGDSVDGPPAGSGDHEVARIQVASIQVVKTVQDPDTGDFVEATTIESGADATFQIVVTNTGEVPLSGIAVGDELGPDCARTFSDTLDPGDSFAAYTCVVAGVEDGFVNVATAAGTPVDGQGDPVGVDVTDDDAAVVDVAAPPVTDLAITKDLIDVDQAAGIATWRIAVTNVGDSPATEPIIVTDDLPAGLRYRNAAGDGWVCDFTDPTVTCVTDTDLATGEATSFTVETYVDAAPGDTVTNTARVDGIDDTDTDNNTDDAVVDVGDQGQPVPHVPGSLPRTGADIAGLLAAAGLLILTGAGLRRASKRPGTT